MEWGPARDRLAKRLWKIQRELMAQATRDEHRDVALQAIVIEGFTTLEDYARFTVAQNVRIFEAVMQLAENTGDEAALAALTERLKAADAKFDAATGD